MNLKNCLYVSALSCIVSLSSCKSTLPGLQNPEVRAELEGVYEGQIDGITVQYTVEKDLCRLQYIEEKTFPGGKAIRTVTIEDVECDNKADSAPDKYGFVRGREYFLQNGTAEKLDSLLEKGQKVVTLENKVKE